MRVGVVALELEEALSPAAESLGLVALGFIVHSSGARKVRLVVGFLQCGVCLCFHGAIGRGQAGAPERGA